MITAEGILTDQLISILPELDKKIKPVYEDHIKPIVIYEISESDAIYTNQAPDLWVYDVQLTIIDDHYSATKRLSNRLQSACRSLEGRSGSGYRILFARDFSASTDNDKEIIGFTTKITFTLTIEEVTP